jgi:HAD superfamily hydrolase (TIGR01509 family)
MSFSGGCSLEPRPSHEQPLVTARQSSTAAGAVVRIDTKNYVQLSGLSNARAGELPKARLASLRLRDLRHAHWIFDLDGTLTVAVHDFAAIRRTLALPPDQGILEAIARLSPQRAVQAMRWLDAHEYELACTAKPAPGASRLLGALRARGARLGIVTRNSLRNLGATLRAADLLDHFDPAGFVTRELCSPKPRPDGILHLLALWRATAADAVMVGNHRIDLEAGRAAGTVTVHVDACGTFPWSEHADLEVTSLADLIPLLGNGAHD